MHGSVLLVVEMSCARLYGIGLGRRRQRMLPLSRTRVYILVIALVLIVNLEWRQCVTLDYSNTHVGWLTEAVDRKR